LPPGCGAPIFEADASRQEPLSDRRRDAAPKEKALRLRSITTAAALLILTWGAGMFQAQQAFTSTTAPPLIVRLSVVAAPYVPATVALRNGEMGRWTRGDGSQYGLTPVVADGSSQLLVFSITPGRTPGTERLQQLGTLALAPGKAAAYPAQAALFEVILLGTAPVPSKTPESAGPEALCTTCCVTCGDWTVCASAVQMECGSCCCEEHCSCFSDTIVQPGCAAPLAGSTHPRLS
jgi:hypothetical protein